MMSVRARLLLGILTLVALGLTIASVTGVVLLRTYLYDRVDEQLGFGTTPRSNPQKIDMCAVKSDNRLPSALVITVLDRRGAVVCTIADETSGDRPKLSSIDRERAKELGSRIMSVPSTTGSSHWHVRVGTLDEHTVLVAVSLKDADDTVNRLTLVAGGTSLAILALTAVGAYAIVGLGMRPLHRIEDTAEKIAAGSFDERVPEGRPGTEVGRLSKAINGMLTQIERAFADRAQSEVRLRRFVADASHELRTPLSTIRGHAELFRQGAASSPQDVAMILGRIESEAARMGALVNDLLLLARLDQARPLEREPVDMLSVVGDAVVDARARQPQRTISLRADTGTALEPPLVSGDEAQLRQVVTNLLSNVLIHTPVEAGLDVAVRVVDDTVVVAVEDHGAGMPPDVVASAFERFYRQDAGRSRKDGGTGLGLAIVRSLVEAHGGNVICQSEVGAGTTFTVSLPLLRDVANTR